MPAAQPPPVPALGAASLRPQPHWEGHCAQLRASRAACWDWVHFYIYEQKTGKEEQNGERIHLKWKVPSPLRQGTSPPEKLTSGTWPRSERAKGKPGEVQRLLCHPVLSRSPAEPSGEAAASAWFPVVATCTRQPSHGGRSPRSPGGQTWSPLLGS